LGGNLRRRRGRHHRRGVDSIAITGGTLGLGFARTFTVNQGFAPVSDFKVTSAMTGTGVNFIKNNPGVLVLNQPETYTGTTTINDGALWLDTGQQSHLQCDRRGRRLARGRLICHRDHHHHNISATAAIRALSLPDRHCSPATSARLPKPAMPRSTASSSSESTRRK